MSTAPRTAAGTHEGATLSDDGADLRTAEDRGGKARGLLTAWILARTGPWLARIALWGASLAALAAYGGYVWWRVRRALRAEGIDDVSAWLHRPDPPQ